MSQGKMSYVTGAGSSPSQRTKQVGLVGGYVHSMARPLHLRQCGNSLSHLRFALAQASHALLSKVVAMFLGGVFDRKTDQLLARLLRLDDSECGRYPHWESRRNSHEEGARPISYAIPSSAPVSYIFSGKGSICARPGSTSNDYQIIKSHGASMYKIFTPTSNDLGRALSIKG
jgi:hypothetical protein